jgi:hypothetical protein
MKRSKNMKLKMIFLLAAVVLINTACASLPAPRQIQDSVIVNASFDRVWQATLESLAELDFTLATPIQKESGLISTELMNIAESQATWWDSGSLNFTQFKRGYRGKVTVFVRADGADQCQVKVISKFEILFVDSLHETLTKSEFAQAVRGEDLFARPCVSTGKIEAEIFERILAKTK